MKIMRPKLLEIEGLQSFRQKQIINFDAVSDTGLFGIFGSTGSGKSTILDAITLALYGKIKRAEGGTQGIINTQCDAARVSFAFDLNRNGSRCSYIVERTFQRKKNSFASCEAKIARLIEINNGLEKVLCDKSTEVSSKVKELIGLSHEDFMRAVVLPQNSFHEFLLLSNKDRRQMLERIFYLEEYGSKLQERLSRKMAQIKSLIDKLEGELSGYEDANMQALEKAKYEYDLLSSEQEKINSDYEILEKEYSNLKQIWETVLELTALKNRQQQLLSQNESIEQKRSKYEKAAKANQMVEEVNRINRLVADIKDIQTQLEKLKEALPVSEKLYLETKHKYEHIRKEAYEKRPVLFERKAKLTEALEIKKEILEINEQIHMLSKEILLQNKQIEKYNAQINNETLQIKEYENKLCLMLEESQKLRVDAQYRNIIHQGMKLEDEGQLIQNEIHIFDENIRVLEKELVDLTKKISGLDIKLENIQIELDAKTKSINCGDTCTIHEKIQMLNDAKSVVSVLMHLAKETEDMEARKLIVQKSLQDEQKQVDELGNLISKQHEICQEIKSKENKIIEKINNHSAVILASRLEEGKPCPVCGSVEHPSPASHLNDVDFKSLNDELELYKKQYEQAQNDLKTYEKKLAAAEQRLQNFQGVLQQIEKELNIKIEKINQQKKLLPQDLQNYDLQAAEKHINQKNSELRNIISDIEHFEKEKNQYILQKNSIEAEINIKDQSLVQMRKALIQKKERLASINRAYMEFLAKTMIDSAKKESERIAEKDKRNEDLAVQISECQKIIDQKRTGLEKYKLQYEDICRNKISLEAQLKNYISLLEQKNSKMKLLCFNDEFLDLEKEIDNIDQQLAKYEKDENSLQNELQILEKQLNQIKNNIDIYKNKLEIYDDSFKKEMLALENRLDKMGFDSIDDIAKNVMNAGDILNIKNEIDEYDRQVFNIKANIERMQDKLQGKFISEDEWNKADSLYSDIKLRKEDIMIKVSVAADNYEKIKNKHNRWKQINKLYKEYKHKYGLYEIIQKLLKAEHRKDNSFIDFIAEERLRYIAAKATQILGEMTKFRYVLEIGLNGEFIIRDNINGGIPRNVSSLSGGETFMTSLALALALSEQIQLKGLSPLEFFFLDEGFGTLDSDTLDYVIESLQKTSRKNRIIGIISHVPEIKARMQRRLIVQPAAVDSGSIVRVEKA